MDTETILERRRLRRRAAFWRIVAFLVIIAAVVVAVGRFADLGTLEGAGAGQVAEVTVDGFITTRPDAVEAIDRAAKAAAVKAIVLRIDSGGGAASGGEALYRAVRRASEQKPVVAVIEGLGASAAYMTAIAADHVVARESAITGSIGVIFQYAHVEELLGKVGVEYEEVKSAPLKGEPSLFREPDPNAAAMLKRVVDDSYDWFVGLVVDRRRMPEPLVRRLADGSIYTGRQAVTLKLVDEVGGMEEARAWLASAKSVSADLPLRAWSKDESMFGMFRARAALAGLARLAGIDAGAASLLPERLTVDGLLSVWQGSGAEGTDR